MTKREIKIGDGWILAKFLFAFLFVKVIKMQKRQGQEDVAMILTEQTWPTKDLLYGEKENFLLGV